MAALSSNTRGLDELKLILRRSKRKKLEELDNNVSTPRLEEEEEEAPRSSSYLSDGEILEDSSYLDKEALKNKYSSEGERILHCKNEEFTIKPSDSQSVSKSSSILVTETNKGRQKAFTLQHVREPPSSRDSGVSYRPPGILPGNTASNRKLPASVQTAIGYTIGSAYKHSNLSKIRSGHPSGNFFYGGPPIRYSGGVTIQHRNETVSALNNTEKLKLDSTVVRDSSFQEMSSKRVNDAAKQLFIRQKEAINLNLKRQALELELKSARLEKKNLQTHLLRVEANINNILGETRLLEEKQAVCDSKVKSCQEDLQVAQLLLKKEKMLSLVAQSRANVASQIINLPTIGSKDSITQKRGFIRMKKIYPTKFIKRSARISLLKKVKQKSLNGSEISPVVRCDPPPPGTSNFKASLLEVTCRKKPSLMVNDDNSTNPTEFMSCGFANTENGSSTEKPKPRYFLEH